MAAHRDRGRGRREYRRACARFARHRGTLRLRRGRYGTARRKGRVVGERRRVTSQRRYPRTARVNEVMLEVLADELERLNDPRLELVTFTGVKVSRDLGHANVYFSTLVAAAAD